MKRCLSLLLCLALLSAFWVPTARAEGLSLTADKSELAAGESITLTLALSEPIENCTTLSFRLWFDSSLFRLTDSACGTVCPELRLSALKKLSGGSAYDLAYLNSESKGIILPAGELYTLSFTAVEDVELSSECSFRLELRNCLDASLQAITLPKAETLTVKLKAVERYQLILRQSTELLLGEGVQLDILISHPNSKIRSFSALDLSLSYDPALLRLDTKSIEGAELNESVAGQLRLMAYGPERSCSSDTAAFRLRFTAIGVGTAKVECGACSVDDGAGANVRNAPAVSLKTPAVSYTIRKSAETHSVTLPDIYTGEKTVADGDDYSFRPTDTNYAYTTPTATVDGVPVSVKTLSDGSYLVEKVSGELVITGSRSAKTYTVTLQGSGREDVTAASKAEYHKDFSFTVTKDEGYTYSVSATVGGSSVSVEIRDGKYVIPGNYITDNIVITVDKLAGSQEDTEYTVTYSGTGMGDARARDGTGTAPTTAEAGKDFVFSIAAWSGYSYSVTVSIGGKNVTPSVSGNVYTIAGSTVTGNILIKIARNSNGSSSSSTSGSSSTTGSASVTVTGEGKDYVSCAKTATLHKDFTFTLSSPEGEEYEPQVSIGGKAVALTMRGSGSYVIPASAVTGAITIHVVRAEEKFVSVCEYLKLAEGECIYCLSVGGINGDGRLYTYGEEHFLFDETHERYVLLLRSKETLETVKASLETLLQRGLGNCEHLTSSGDANESGRMDINDAQYIFNCYLLRESLELEKLQALLRLDVNGDGELDTGDAVAVMTAIKEAEK